MNRERPIDPTLIKEAVDTLTSELDSIDAVIRFLKKARVSSHNAFIDEELSAASKLLTISRIRLAMELEELEHWLVVDDLYDSNGNPIEPSSYN